MTQRRILFPGEIGIAWRIFLRSSMKNCGSARNRVLDNVSMDTVHKGNARNLFNFSGARF